jgi:hypothetical protein
MVLRIDFVIVALLYDRSHRDRIGRLLRSNLVQSTLSANHNELCSAPLLLSVAVLSIWALC